MEFTNFLTDDERLEQGGLVAAIDVGSNGMRLGIAAYDAHGVPQLVQRYREPVRLGHDAFTTGELSAQTMNDTVSAFQQFKRILEQYHIEKYRAVATSAMRDSKNASELIRRIFDETGIVLELITGEEEARFVHYSISRRVDIARQFVLLVDMGGGSVEVTLCDDGEVVSAQSLSMGTVRLLEMLGQEGDFNLLMAEYMDGARKKLQEQIGKRKASICIATGGNAGALGAVIFQYFQGESATLITRKQLKALIVQLEKMTLEERMRDLNLRPDRADVILPAAIVFHEMMRLAKAKTMMMPEASLLDGILLDMMDAEGDTLHSRRSNLLAMARNMGKRFHVDRRYAKSVSRLALRLFDQMGEQHGLGTQERMLLEIACRIHEVGMYVSVGGHHRHAAYLILAASLLGLSAQDKAVLAQTVRYQRKSTPTLEHEEFAQLSKESQRKVCCLSVLLRLAIALNKDRRNRVYQVDVRIEASWMMLQLIGHGDLLLERWAALKVGDYVQQVYGLTLKVEVKSLSAMALPSGVVNAAVVPVSVMSESVVGGEGEASEQTEV